MRRCGIIQTISLSKAFGGFGGAILLEKELRQTIIQRSTLFAGSTPLPLPVARAALESVTLIGAGRSLRERLRQNGAAIVARLLRSGFQVSPVPGPIVVVTPVDAVSSRRLENHFLCLGIYPPLTKYPGLASSGLFRCVISSEHTEEQLDTLAEALRLALQRGWIKRQATGPCGGASQASDRATLAAFKSLR
jgi:7-keto-8-aminopelargonate synthetase-like enzyme